MTKTKLLLASLLLTASSAAVAQIEKSIRLNEVMPANTASIQDEFGSRLPWIEIANVSHSTYNIRGMYVTTDRSVLDKSMSAPERMRRMSMIPNGDERTNMGARQHLIYYCNSNPAKGANHLGVMIESQKPTWIALYEGNGVNLIDSVTVPALAPDMSFARLGDGAAQWVRKKPAEVTPGIANTIGISESKVERVKREDPYGIGITVLSMGIVFFCLTLLFLFFYVFGLIMRHQEAAKKVANLQPIKVGVKTVEKTLEVGHKTNVILQDGLKSKGIDKEVYMAVIAMALRQYEEDTHDVESGVITIKTKHSEWNHNL